MLQSLAIKNYRNIKDLMIESLGQVNLITGKNNTGKSTLLEAIGIYATKGDLGFIRQLLQERGENANVSDSKIDETNSNIKILSSMFHNRSSAFSDNIISIGSIDDNLFGKILSFDDSVSLRFVRFVDEFQNDVTGGDIRRRKVVTDKEIEEGFLTYKIGFEILIGQSSSIRNLNIFNPITQLTYTGLRTSDNLQFIQTRNIDRSINGRLWDGIALTEKEQLVIEALKIIEPTTERIAFIEKNRKERSAVIKLANSNTILPLRSMGDGINRILTIILALVNADNGFLLIDEFENGLHHTTQEKLWNIIFHLSQKLNVQVFATTHSEDCIVGFENVLNNSSTGVDGKMIRLDNIDGVIKQVEFNGNELRIANENDIEIR